MIAIEQVKQHFQQKQWKNITDDAEAILSEGNEEAIHFLAMACVHQKLFADATKYFLQLAEKNSLSASWFNVCTAAAANKDFPLAKEAYQKSIDLLKYEKRPAIPQQVITYMYMCALTDAGNYADALPLLHKMKDHYKSIFITTDAFVHARGLPIIKQLSPYIKKIFTHTEDKNMMKNWFADFIAGVDAEGKEKLKKLEKEITDM